MARRQGVGSRAREAIEIERTEKGLYAAADAVRADAIAHA